MNEFNIVETGAPCIQIHWLCDRSCVEWMNDDNFKVKFGAVYFDVVVSFFSLLFGLIVTVTIVWYRFFTNQTESRAWDVRVKTQENHKKWRDTFFDIRHDIRNKTVKVQLRISIIHYVSICVNHSCNSWHFLTKLLESFNGFNFLCIMLEYEQRINTNISWHSLCNRMNCLLCYNTFAA